MPPETSLLAAAAFALAACAHADDGPGAVRVMTLNMDEGTGYERLLGATTPFEFVAAVAATFQDIEATRPSERAMTLADEIVARQPDLVGLQEASMVRTGAPPASAVASDLLESLLDELAARGERYRVVAIGDRLDAEAPSLLGFDVRLTTRDAILARERGDLVISNARGSTYAVNLRVPTPVGPITLPRGWLAVDVQAHHGAFTFVSTHLDTVAPIQSAQMAELMQITAALPLPLVLSGDFNSVADSPSDPTHGTYQQAIDAGFVDGWSAPTPGDAGYTCCQDPALTNAASMLDQRIDWILVRRLRVANISLVGNRPDDRTPSGLWPSDHAGLVATVTSH
jgi:endonuclease/exonuclease/phosphatase family metal-dependent hydrolase